MTDQIFVTYFLSTVSPHTAWEHCGCKPLTQLAQQAGWHSEVLYAMLRRELRSPPHQNLRDSQQPGRKKEQSVPIPVLFQASMLQSKASFGLLVVQLTLVIYWTFPPYILLNRWYSVLCHVWRLIFLKKVLQLETIWLLNFLGFSTSPNSLHGRVIGYLRDIHCSLLCINITHATAGRENRTLGILELEGSALWHKEHDRTAQACTVFT